MPSIRELFNRHASNWPDCNARILRRLDDVFIRDESKGFMLPDGMRSRLVRLYNAIDMHNMACRGGVSPLDRARYLWSRDQILERIA
jgi:hypothetical protein